MREMDIPFSGKREKRVKSPGFIIISMIITLLFSNCIKTVPVINQDTNAFYHYYIIKVKLVTEKGKSKFRSLLRFNDSGDRIIFLGALNQVLFETIIRSENTLIVIPRKKNYWRGNFSEFIKSFWNMEFTYSELKELLIQEKLPEKRVNRNYPKIRIDKSSIKYTRFLIASEKTSVELTLFPEKLKRGLINFHRDLSKYKRINLNRMNYGGKDKR